MKHTRSMAQKRLTHTMQTYTKQTRTRQTYMKQMTMLMLGLVLMLLMTACGSTESESTSEAESTLESDEEIGLDLITEENEVVEPEVSEQIEDPEEEADMVEPQKEETEGPEQEAAPVEPQQEETEDPEEETTDIEEEQAMQIRVTAGEIEIVYELNGSSAAVDLYEQLPISIAVENYSNNEKIFYPEEELDTMDTPLAEDGAGTLAYYAPWGDVVMFYGDYGTNSQLFELGKVISGGDQIRELSGTIEITPVE